MTGFRHWLTEPLPRWAVLLFLLGPIGTQAVVNENAQERDDKINHAAATARRAARVAFQEGRIREDQFCERAEREHQTLVRQYSDTLDYLDSLKGDRMRLAEPINQFVLSRLPETEKRARRDTAPPICDKPGRGLPEPDPVLPKRTAEDIQRSLTR